MTQSAPCASKNKTKTNKSRPRKTYNLDHYHRCQMSMPAIEEIENRITAWLNPFDWKPTKMFVRKEKLPIAQEYKLRSRKLDLMVIMAIILSLIYRQLNSLTEVVRILNLRGLMWTKAIKVSKQALSKRLQTLPAELIADIFSQTLESIHNSQQSSNINIVPEKYQSVVKSFSAIWIADGSTLEALKRKLKV